MGKETKSSQLQIRVSAVQKAAIEHAAARAGMDMSAYVLKALLPEPAAVFGAKVEACLDPDSINFALADLNTFLSNLTASELRIAVAAAPAQAMSTEFLANYVAAMVEYACALANVPAPAWARTIEPCAVPFFGSTLTSLRLYLLTHSPAPFRRRNLFVDSSLGAQV